MCLFGSASEWFLVHGWLYGDDIMMAAKGCTRVATRVWSDYRMHHLRCDHCFKISASWFGHCVRFAQDYRTLALLSELRRCY